MSISAATRPTRLAAFAAIMLLCCCVSGCGEPSTDLVIQGQVSFRGEPLTAGSLAFFPTKGRPTMAVVSPDGTYSCQLAPGEYRVTVTLGVQLPAGWKRDDPIPPPKVVLPIAYNSRVQTPLKAVIVAEQNEAVDFSLE